MKKILVLGANSAIAKAVCRLWAEQGHLLYLVGRDSDKLNALVADLKVRSKSSIFAEVVDLRDRRQHDRLLKAASEKLGGLDRLFLAFGELGDQKQAEKNPEQLFDIMEINFLSPISLLSLAANIFEAQGRGEIVAISSVAGDRARQSNYIYGSAKGALSLFLQGLRNRLHHSGVQVTDLKLGFVDTPMTSHIKKGPLWAKPEVIAGQIVKAVDKRRDLVYLPFFWSGIMLVIRLIPEFIFKRLKL